MAEEACKIVLVSFLLNLAVLNLNPGYQIHAENQPLKVLINIMFPFTIDNKHTSIVDIVLVLLLTLYSFHTLLLCFHY